MMEKARVLIVDDQEDILTSLGAILLDEGHEVLKAHDGQEALHAVQSDSPDIVFLDIWIPGIDGMQTLKAIKRIAPQCHVIMMSGHGTIETAVKAIKLGAEDYLEKPLNLEDTLHLVERAISSQNVRPEIIDFSAGNPGPLIGASPLASNIRRSIENAAKETGSVWIYGEKGSGKEFLARITHFLSGQDRQNLIKISCHELNPENIRGTIPAKLIDSSSSKLVRVGAANNATLLFVGIDRLNPGLGPALLAILEEITGNHHGNPVPPRSIRFVSTSKKSPDDMLLDGFPDQIVRILGHRIVRTPPLRERPEDIPLLVRHFLAEASREFDKEILGIEQDALLKLIQYSWPGNIKELKILVEHAVMNASGQTLTTNELLLPTSESHCGKENDIRSSSKDKRQLSSTTDSTRHKQPQPDETFSDFSSDNGILHQRTLRGKAVIYGLGLHSGQKTGLTISPLPPSSGINFGHITSGGTVPALLSHVESTDFCTSLRGNGALARTVEHLMAVFHVYGLTNLLVKISGEVPIMDGSALEFCNLVESAEIITQNEIVEKIVINEPFEIPLPQESSKFMRIEPSEVLEIEYQMDYPQPIGKMSMSFRLSDIAHFKSEIAPARTFGFVKDIRMMDEMGLAGGGKLSNVVLVDEEKVVNPPLRFEDEFVRHKILDILGDFYLLGRPIVGKIFARQTGHAENIAMLRLINDKLGIL
jgi:UDP-3-O-[3-hydroxymyristoyl] N-acetylglucosamine deacetylase